MYIRINTIAYNVYHVIYVYLNIIAIISGIQIAGVDFLTPADRPSKSPGMRIGWCQPPVPRRTYRPSAGPSWFSGWNGNREVTLLETNIVPDIRPSSKGHASSNHPFSGAMLVSVMEVILPKNGWNLRIMTDKPGTTWTCCKNYLFLLVDSILIS